MEGWASQTLDTPVRPSRRVVYRRRQTQAWHTDPSANDGRLFQSLMRLGPKDTRKKRRHMHKSGRPYLWKKTTGSRARPQPCHSGETGAEVIAILLLPDGPGTLRSTSNSCPVRAELVPSAAYATIDVNVHVEVETPSRNIPSQRETAQTQRRVLSCTTAALLQNLGVNDDRSQLRRELMRVGERRKKSNSGRTKRNVEEVNDTEREQQGSKSVGPRRSLNNF